MAHPGGGGNNMTAEQLSSRYIGTGHADMTKHAWLTNQHRDTAASTVGHYADQLAYYAVATNESMGRTRLELLESMLQPCGPPPPPPKDTLQLLRNKNGDNDNDHHPNGAS